MVVEARLGRSVESSLQKKVDALDWECEEADTRGLTHGVHRYSGKFIPQVARQVIDLLSLRGDLVLDPFCGSGTTLLESYISGRRAIGIDMNPLAILVARTKCTPIPRERLDGLVKSMKAASADIGEGGCEPTLFSHFVDSRMHHAIKSDPRLRDEWYRKWFDESGLYQLVGIHRAVMSIPDLDLRNVALTAFSDILRRCSHAHGGYPNVMYNKRRLKRPEPLPLFLSRLHEFCEAIASLTKCENWGWKPEVHEGDARQTGLPTESVDTIITHPPYIGSIPYAEYGTLSLTWLGHDPRNVDNRLMGGKRQSRHVLERFNKEYGAMLSESYRVLKPEKHLFVLVGHPLVKGERVNLADVTGELAQRAGFSLIARTTRVGMNRRANKMGEEDLLFFRKPRS